MALKHRGFPQEWTSLEVNRVEASEFHALFPEPTSKALAALLARLFPSGLAVHQFVLRHRRIRAGPETVGASGLRMNVAACGSHWRTLAHEQVKNRFWSLKPFKLKLALTHVRRSAMQSAERAVCEIEGVSPTSPSSQHSRHRSDQLHRSQPNQAGMSFGFRLRFQQGRSKECQRSQIGTAAGCLGQVPGFECLCQVDVVLAS